MPEVQRDQVEISIGGRTQAAWTRYEVDSDLMTPADAWQVQLTTAGLRVPAEVVEGAPVTVRLASELVMTGLLDERTTVADGSRVDLRLAGRDQAAVLLDCSAPITSGLQLTLPQVIAKFVQPLGITKWRVDAERTYTLEKVSTEPGDTAWEALRRAAEANGLWPWFEPDGTLVVGGPRYDVPPVAQLVLRLGEAARDNNVLAIEERRSLHDRYSEVTVLGQAAATGLGGAERGARSGVKAVVKDTGLTCYRPKCLVNHEATSQAIASAFGRKFLSDARLKCYGLQITVQGHRIGAGQAGAGKLWTPGQRVVVISEPHGIEAVYFLMARRFQCDERTGQLTRLGLKEDGVWTLDAHPSRRKHRRGKNALPGRVLDLSGGTS